LAARGRAGSSDGRSRILQWQVAWTDVSDAVRTVGGLSETGYVEGRNGRDSSPTWAEGR